MVCAECGVEVAPESAVAQLWCWRCGVKKEKEKALETYLAGPIVPAELAPLVEAVLADSMVQTELPADVAKPTATYEEVAAAYEREIGSVVEAQAAARARSKKGHK